MKDIEEKYLNELIYIKIKYLKENKRTYYGKYDCLDEEQLHIELDDLLINLLEEIGFSRIAREYLEAKSYFWYS